MEESKDYRVNVFDSIERRLSLGFWIAVGTVISMILAIGWYGGVNEKTDQQQDKDITNQGVKIDSLDAQGHRQQIDIVILKRQRSK